MNNFLFKIQNTLILGKYKIVLKILECLHKFFNLFLCCNNTYKLLIINFLLSFFIKSLLQNYVKKLSLILYYLDLPKLSIFVSFKLLNGEDVVFKVSYNHKKITLYICLSLSEETKRKQKTNSTLEFKLVL